MVPPAFVAKDNLGIAITGETVPLTYRKINFALPCEGEWAEWISSFSGLLCTDQQFSEPLRDYLSLRVLLG